ncbi:MAG: DUF177 domain-containing protein [Clostridia bacterium]|jgi:uncharacterized protein|nr:DUF177 domain-containing protein [Clostridia bacterium]
MLLDMTQLLGGAVDRLDFSYTLSADRVPYEGAEALLDGENTDAQRIGDNEENEGIYPIVFDDVVVLEPVAVNGSVINRAGYITLTAEASMSYRTHCARCLAEVEDTVRFLCEKTVADEKGLLRLENTENDDYVQIKGGKLDLDAPICDEILLGFPMRILCSDDCKGLCAGCGADLNREACRCTKKEVDPRLAKLAALLAEMPDDEE